VDWEHLDIAKSYGFDFNLWVPIRNIVDGIEPTGQKNPNADQAFSLMYQAGLSGVGLQEQFFIDRQCIPARVSAFNETLNLHITAAGGVKPFMLVNTLVESCNRADEFAVDSCGLPQNHYPWQHCDQFIDQISDQLDALSINDQPSLELIHFLQFIRSEGLFQIFLPLSVRH
jgi:hypothetical protein